MVVPYELLRITYITEIHFKECFVFLVPMHSKAIFCIDSGMDVYRIVYSFYFTVYDLFLYLQTEKIEGSEFL